VTLTVAPHANTTANRIGTIQLTPANGGVISTLSVTQARLIVLATEQSDSLIIYPNPVQDVLTIRLSGAFSLPATVRLINSNGQIVRQSTTRQLMYKAMIGELPPGVYLLTVTSKNGKSFTRKLIRN
jgi:hypothetical protein